MANKTGWPKDRDVLYNPQRKAYHKGPRPDHCVFCDAKKRKPAFSNLVLYKGKNFMVVLNKYPYQIAHMMVMPKRHIGQIWALKDQEYMDIHFAIRDCLKILEQEYNCQGMNMGINLGKAAGAGIPKHLHYHLIPRWNGDTNFFPTLAGTRVMSESLEETYERLKAPIEKVLKGIDK